MCGFPVFQDIGQPYNQLRNTVSFVSFVSFVRLRLTIGEDAKKLRVT